MNSDNERSAELVRSGMRFAPKGYQGDRFVGKEDGKAEKGAARGLESEVLLPCKDAWVNMSRARSLDKWCG